MRIWGLVAPMVGIIKFFGVLSIIVGVILIVISFATIFLLSTLLPLGASALLGGALLIAFARVVELLEKLNEKLIPVHSIAIALEGKYNPDQSKMTAQAADATFDPKNPIVDPLTNLPPGSQIERHFSRRVAFLPDNSVIGETDTGLRKFKTFEEWRRFIGK
jgi:hypothetical protein